MQAAPRSGPGGKKFVRRGVARLHTFPDTASAREASILRIYQALARPNPPVNGQQPRGQGQWPMLAAIMLKRFHNFHAEFARPSLKHAEPCCTPKRSVFTTTRWLPAAALGDARAPPPDQQPPPPPAAL